MDKYKVLLVEDDATLADTLCYNLEGEGYAVCRAADIARAEALAGAGGFDLYILDVNLPDGSGFDLCGRLVETEGAPVIFLTANDLEEDMLRGYELGADDYVTKPFSLDVFLKKVAAVLRRSARPDTAVYSDGYLNVDFNKMTASAGGADLRLTPLEFRILRVLTASPGTVITRLSLLGKLWDADENFVDEHALTAGMSRLRGKIEAGGCRYIKTIYGMGYMWTGGGDG